MTKRFRRLRAHNARAGGKSAFLNPKGEIYCDFGESIQRRAVARCFMPSADVAQPPELLPPAHHHKSRHRQWPAAK